MEIRYEPACAQDGSGESVVRKFHQSDSFIRGLKGPVGSSKTSACVVDIAFGRAYAQKPHNGVRRTRWAILRNTYPELKSTTIKTFQEWVPEQICPFKWDAPISARLRMSLPDKTQVEAEFLFLALDRPEDVGKLKSLEVTGAWLNEGSEMSKAVFDMVTQRVGRFPPQREGGATWSGVIVDYNPPDSDNWIYKLAEEPDYEQIEKLEDMLRKHGALGQTQKLMEFFHQPGGLKFVGGEYLPNPKAENIPNLPGGYGYYIRQMVGKSKEWIKVFVLGEYGTVISGRPVYPEYSDDIHCAKEPFRPMKRTPLLIGFDYGLTPAAAICQLTPRGQLLVLDELTSEGMGIRQFARDVLKPHIANHYADWKNNLQCVGDPAGLRKSDTDERTCFMELADEGFICMPALTNDILARTEAVKKFLTRMTDGKPALYVSPNAKKIRQGFLGKYCYERVQVTGKEIYRDKPVKNDYSHPHDALQYVCMYVHHVELSSWKEQMPKPKVAMI